MTLMGVLQIWRKLSEKSQEGTLKLEKIQKWCEHIWIVSKSSPGRPTSCGSVFRAAALQNWSICVCSRDIMKSKL